LTLVLGIDFETYWAQDYTLNKMSPREYVNDPRFEIIGVAFKRNTDEPIWVTDTDTMMLYFASIDWDDTIVYGHNLNFDGAILTWRFGVKPKQWLDTLAMARARVKPFTGSASLASCAEFLKLGESKGNMAFQAKGLRRRQMTPAFLRDYGVYCCRDIRLTAGVARKLLPHFSQSEVQLIDRTVRMYLEPRLRLDAAKLAAHHANVLKEKKALLERVTADKATLMSNAKFGEALRNLGVEPPTKISKATGEETFAFAKSDLDFTALLEHWNPEVQALVAARLGTKSTIEETRTKRLLDIAIQFETLAVPLLYAGAHTGRFSGAEKLNLQNLMRGSPIRGAIEAPLGYLLVVADASQIEARLLAWFCRQWNIVEAFATGQDVYAVAASGIYHYEVSKEDNPRERQVGKVATLQLGYGSGYQTFWHMCKVQKIDMDLLEAESITQAWRANNPHIVRCWYSLFARVKYVFMQGQDYEEDFRCVQIGYSKELHAGYIRLPGGYTLWYPNPCIGEGADGREGFGYWKAQKNGGYHKTLWHGEIMNNVIQALARVITMGHGLQISAYPAAPWVLQVHDELMFVPRKQHADLVAEACKVVMSTPPAWCKELPLDAEVHVGRNYGECK
jgi:hypothetical protein